MVLVSVALAALTMLALWLVTDRTIRMTLDESAKEAVNVDIAGLADIYATGGLEELQRRIDDRLTLKPSDGSVPHYLLTDNNGTVLSGDISAWPALDARISESGMITLGHSSTAQARATQLDAQLRLLVAHEADPADRLLLSVRGVFLAGGLVLIIVVALFGIVSSNRLKHRIERISHSLQNPGEPNTPLPNAHGDEIDELASHSAAVIRRIQRLLVAHRDTTDRLAHEIRTPLMHLDARLVKALEAAPGEGAAARLTEGRAEIRRLVGMLESLLDIAWSKARQGDPTGLKPVDFSQLVNKLCELYADSAEEAGLTLTWQVSPAVIIDGEETQLTRLLANLLDNAIKYVPAGGHVEVKLLPGAVLSVRDDGDGIAEADRDRIFERFHRGTGVSADPDRPGAGLGLALAQAIAQRHGLVLECLPCETGAHFLLRREPR